MEVKIKVKDDNVIIPDFATQGSAGIDFHAHSWIKKFNSNNIELTTIHMDMHKETIHINPGERVLVGTGIFMEIPFGYLLDIRPRSGNSLKQGMIVVNSPGTIDSDYRGEIGIIIGNVSSEPIYITLNSKIAQGVFLKHERPHYHIIKDLSETERGSGGFGSTGK